MQVGDKARGNGDATGFALTPALRTEFAVLGFRSVYPPPPPPSPRNLTAA